MPAYVDTFNLFVSLGSIAMQCVVVLLALNLIFFRSRKNALLLFFKKYAFQGGFVIAFSSIVLSLFYSNIIGFPACELCWLQRICLYPQVVLFGLDLWKRNRTIVDHSLILAIIGSIISAYHVYIENGGASDLACSGGGNSAAVAHTVSCATRYVFDFGYITIPVMALTAGVFIVLLLVNYKYMVKQPL